MAISCFAMPLAGLPTLRIRFTFPPAHLSSADDSDRFFFISRPPYCIDDKKSPAYDRLPNALATRFMRRVFRIGPIQPVDVTEDFCRVYLVYLVGRTG